jgi:hypothetical protein
VKRLPVFLRQIDLPNPFHGIGRSSAIIHCSCLRPFAHTRGRM